MRTNAKPRRPKQSRTPRPLPPKGRRPRQNKELRKPSAQRLRLSRYARTTPPNLPSFASPRHVRMSYVLRRSLVANNSARNWCSYGRASRPIFCRAPPLRLRSQGRASTNRRRSRRRAAATCYSDAAGQAGGEAAVESTCSANRYCTAAAAAGQGDCCRGAQARDFGGLQRDQRACTAWRNK